MYESKREKFLYGFIINYYGFITNNYGLITNFFNDYTYQMLLQFSMDSTLSRTSNEYNRLSSVPIAQFLYKLITFIYMFSNNLTKETEIYRVAYYSAVRMVVHT